MRQHPSDREGCEPQPANHLSHQGRSGRRRGCTGNVESVDNRYAAADSPYCRRSAAAYRAGSGRTALVSPIRWPRSPSDRGQFFLAGKSALGSPLRIFARVRLCLPTTAKEGGILRAAGLVGGRCYAPSHLSRQKSRWTHRPCGRRRSPVDHRLGLRGNRSHPCGGLRRGSRSAVAPIGAPPTRWPLRASVCRRCRGRDRPFSALTISPPPRGKPN